MATVEEMMRDAQYSEKMGGSVFNQNTKYQPKVKATSTGVLENQYTRQPQTESQKLFGANEDPFAWSPQQDGPYGSTQSGIGVQPMQAPVQSQIVPDATKPIDYSLAYNSKDGLNTAEFGKLDSTGQGQVMDIMKAEELAAGIKDANSFDWMGAANVGLQGANTLMEIGMYGDKKDYMQNVNAGLEQNMKNAQATHDNRATQQQNLGSTFSRNA